VLLAACGGGAGTMDPGPDATITPDAAGDPTAAQLLGAISTCTVIGGKYAKDVGGAATVDICGLTNAVYWKADLDVDCDGKMTTQCSLATDPDYMNQTAATDSHNMPLDAATLPYVVVPGVSSRWSYRASGLAMGSVVAVIYGDHLEYGVIGDVGPVSAIGEASYAMAKSLTIDPNPRTGGTAAEVAYIAFTGVTAEVDVIEDHAMAVQIGVARAKALLGL